jgi:uncharacterized membrane protein YdjX (TVP38/TMEM64 family)/rhodanese-related sulfurtransferase
MGTIHAKLTRAALLAALAAALALAFANREAFSQEALQAWLASAGWWAPIVFIAIYAAGTVLFLPGSVLTLAAGALFGILPGALYSLAGATLGAVLAFLVARHLAGEWVAQKTGGRLKQLIEGVEAEGWRFVAFVRLVPLFPFNVVNYALGLTRIPLAAYALTSAVCMLPGALAYAWLGHAGRAALAGDANAIRSGMLALAVAAALMFLPRLMRQFKAGLMITPEMLRTLQAEGSVTVVDVRDAKDFTGETGHVPGALNLPLGELPARIEELAPWRKDAVVLICRTQVRSGQAARLLAKHGFSGLRVVRGGILAWRELGYPTEGGTVPITPIAESALGHNHA